MSGEEGRWKGVGAALSPWFQGLAPSWATWPDVERVEGIMGAVLGRVTMFCFVLSGLSPACQPCRSGDKSQEEAGAISAHPHALTGGAGEDGPCAKCRAHGCVKPGPTGAART